MTELQVKGLIGALCKFMFGKYDKDWMLFTNEYSDKGIILIETTNCGKFIGSINEVYCELERLFFSGEYKHN